MAVFHKDLIKRVDAYKKAAAKAQATERALLSEFETMDFADVQKLIGIVEEKGHPNHQAFIREFADKLKNGEYTAEDIVRFQNTVDANRCHIEGENHE